MALKGSIKKDTRSQANRLACLGIRGAEGAQHATEHTNTHQGLLPDHMQDFSSAMQRACSNVGVTHQGPDAEGPCPLMLCNALWEQQCKVCHLLSFGQEEQRTQPCLGGPRGLSTTAPTPSLVGCPDSSAVSKLVAHTGNEPCKVQS